VGRSGVVGIQAALLHTGQVIFFARPEDPSHKLNDLVNGLPDDWDMPQSQPKSKEKCPKDEVLSTLLELTADGTFKARPLQVRQNPFCAGLTLLADGRLFVAGGDKRHCPRNERTPPETDEDGRYSLRVFDPAGKTWQAIGEMSDARWYPTCTLLPDGRVFIVSGYLDDMEVYNNQNPTCEIYSPDESKKVAPQYLPLLVETWPYDSYPFVFVLPSGSLFLLAKDRAHYLKLASDGFGRERWTAKIGPTLPARVTGGEEPAKQYPNSASAVLLPLLPEKGYAAEVLVVGGGGLNVHPHWETVPGTNPQMKTREVKASDSCFRMFVDPPGFPAEWERRSPLNYARVMPDAVLLPDRTVLVLNGASRGFGGGYAGAGPAVPRYAVREPELYDPNTDRWLPLAAAEFPRLYHATALLLPDATVLVAGSDHQVHREDLPEHAPEEVTKKHLACAYEYRLEAFEPPYLYRGHEKAPRPVLTGVQESVEYGQAFDIKVAGLRDDVTDAHLSAALLRPGSVTHGNNMSQRYVGLTIKKILAPTITLEAPPNANIAPPGYYMLFLLQDGVPSEAAFVRLDSSEAGGASDGRAPREGMALWLRADNGVEATEDGQVTAWRDVSGNGNDVVVVENRALSETLTVTEISPGQFREELTPAPAQAPADTPVQRPPRVVNNEANGKPAVRFTLTMKWEATMVPYGACLESKRKAFMPGSGSYAVFIVTNPWPPATTLAGFQGPGGFNGGWSDVLGWGHLGELHPERETFVALRLGSGPRIRDGSALPKVPATASIFSYRNTARQFGNGDADPLLPLSSPVLIEMFFDESDDEAKRKTGIRVNGHLKQEGAAARRNTLEGPFRIGQLEPMTTRKIVTTRLDGRTAAPEHQVSQGAFFRGDIAEIIVYDRHLDHRERYGVQEYLRRKYDLW
jgi:hypothetical protein